MMSTIHKLKALVSVLIKDKHDLINEARTIYFKHNTITYDYDLELIHKEKKSERNSYYLNE